MRRLAAALAALLLLRADMFQDAGNAEQPAALNNITKAAGSYYAPAYGACTWDAAHDIGPCINAALAAAAAGGGGIVNLPAGAYGLGAKITWPLAGAVRLICPSGGGSASPATTLKWIGAAGGRMVEIKPASGHITGPEIRYCGFDGNGKLAADGIYAASAHGGRFENLTFRGGFNGGAVFTLTVEAAGDDAQNNIIENLYIDSDGLGSTSTQLYLGTYINPATGTGANASLNYIRNYSIVNNTGTGTAIVCDGCDNNYFSGRIYSAASVDLKVKVVGAHMFGANGNVFAPAIQYNGTFIARGQATTPACVPYTTCTHSNYLLIDSTNGAPAPTVEAGADLQWGGNQGYRAGTMLIGNALKPGLLVSPDTTLSQCRDAAAGTGANQYICNTSDTALLAYTSLAGDAFSQRLSGAAGGKNLLFERQAGTGMVAFVGVPVGFGAATVATLPTCNATRKYGVMSVSDQSGAPTYRGALTGGGALAVLAYCNGTSWEAH